MKDSAKPTAAGSATALAESESENETPHLPRAVRDLDLVGMAWLADGNAASPRGFLAAGIHCGIKRSKSDLALLVSEQPASAAGLFTSNRIQAPPVVYCRQRLTSSPSARAIVVNSGNANACTGKQGWADTVETAELVAEALGCEPEEVLVASTGVIGRLMPMAAVRNGVPAAVAALSRSGREAAEAILTTDTHVKAAGLEIELAGGVVTLGGMAKGSGMIAPDMIGPDRFELGAPGPDSQALHATTLVFLSTDAVIPSAELQGLLATAMATSFNAITVDGDTSTNDTAICLANGASGIGLEGDRDRARFVHALTALSTRLALDVVRDGEGATRLIEVRVSGAKNDEQGSRIARTVADSPLVKTAFNAGEPNWGRLMMAVGRAGCQVDADRVRIAVGDLVVVLGGLGTTHDPQHLTREMTQPEVTIDIDVGIGDGTGRIWTCDLSEEYVRINSRYLT